jgi:hypothetical protein
MSSGLVFQRLELQTRFIAAVVPENNILPA